jgi:hypothetical protein
MPEVPEGRCMVCRAAWEPCRRCAGQARARKAEATMARNGTSRPKGKKWEDIVYGTQEAGGAYN